MQSPTSQRGSNDQKTQPRFVQRVRAARLPRAFTIIEVVVVLLVMGILAAVAAPTFYESLLFHRVESAARRVKSDLELARSQARLTSSKQSITFLNSTYTITNTKHLDNANYLYTVDLKQSPYSLDSATADFSNSTTILFDGYGAPSSGGTIVLVLKTHQCAVTLDSATGNVTITSNHPGGGAEKDSAQVEAD